SDRISCRSPEELGREMLSDCPLIMGGVLHKPADTAAVGRDKLVRRAAGRLVYAGWVTYFDPQAPAHVESDRQMWKDIAGTALLEALRRLSLPGTPLRIATLFPSKLCRFCL